MKNNNSSTVRETFLQTELDRIRSTYSFRLGLLLTNSIVRKPWMAIFLPFTFLKMNVNFLRDRKARKLSGENPISRVGGNCLMLITASEEGVSASERTISIAKAWLKQKDHKVVVVSTNENLTSMTIQGVSHYQIPDPKIHRDISTSEWNDVCANIVRGAIETHIPYTIIFDGTYPYRGILNALSISPYQKKIWLRADNIDAKVIERAGGIFDTIITPGELGGGIETTIQPFVEPNNREPSNCILVATGYGRHQLRDKMNKFVNNRFSDEMNHTFIFPKNANIGSIPIANVKFWDTVAMQPEFQDLKAAVICDDINLATMCCNSGIPTLCLIDDDTQPQLTKKLNKIADLGNLFITNSSDSSEINLYLNALLDINWIGVIRQRSLVDMSSDWQDLFDICME